MVGRVLRFTTFGAVLFLCGVLLWHGCKGDTGTTPPPPACSFSISPTSKSFASKGGTGTVNISTADGCSWSATSSSNFIRITSASSGTGNGSITFAVDPNGDTSSREGTLNVAQQTFRVTQEGAAAAQTFKIRGNVHTADATISFTGPGAHDPVDSETDGSYEQSGFANGQYDVRVSKECFVFDPSSQMVTIKDGNMNGVNFQSGEAVVASFVITTPQSGRRAGSPIKFDGKASFSMISQYCWDFGDKSGTECKNRSDNEHTYAANAGCNTGGQGNLMCTRDKFTVKLTVKDSGGCASDPDSKKLEIDNFIDYP